MLAARLLSDPAGAAYSALNMMSSIRSYLFTKSGEVDAAFCAQEFKLGKNSFFPKWGRKTGRRGPEERSARPRGAVPWHGLSTHTKPNSVGAAAPREMPVSGPGRAGGGQGA